MKEKITMLRLIMTLFLCANTVTAMKKITIESQNNDMPCNFKELMPYPFVHSAELAAEGKFDEIIKYWIELNKENKSAGEEFCSDLKEVYTKTKNGFNAHRDKYDDSVTEEKQIHNNMLRYFWHRHYVHELDRIAFEKHDAEVQQRRLQSSSAEESTSSTSPVVYDRPSREERKTSKNRGFLNCILSCFSQYKKK